MKKKNILIVMSLLIILLTVISSCNSQVPTPSATGVPTSTSDEARIKELEAQIVMLMQNQQLSDNERKQEIAALEAKIEKLKATEPPTPLPSESEAPKSFTYTVPASVDGYQVYSIGSDALTSSKIKSVIISSGIEKLDWFAFRNCINLSSVSIPDSVTSIGYGAFDNTSRSLTIRCSRDSFAHKYAQSYGITYDIT